MEGGNSIEDSVAFAPLFEKAGADAISIQVGWHESLVPTVATSVPRGSFVFLADKMRSTVSVPIMTCNRINDPILAEQILADGNADFIAMARALNADPYLPRKVRERRLDEIVPCTGCNEGCLDMVFAGQRSTCMNNPIRGREEELAITPVASPKKVMVVGGGPGGLEAARVLVERGHEVKLYEKAEQFGGRLALSSIPHGRQEFENTIRYLADAARRAGVEMVLGKEMTAELAKEEKLDAVVLAIGGYPRVPDIPGIDNENVVMSEDILTGKAPLGRNVVVIGAGGVACEVGIYVARRGCISPEAALFLVEHGVLSAEEATDLALKGPRRVTLVRRGHKVGDSLGRSTRWVVLQELKRLGVRMVTEAQYIRISESGLLVSVGGQKQMIEADTIVIAAGYEANPHLKEAWREVAPEVHVIGDAHTPQKGIDAIYAGTLVGRQI